MNNQIYRNNRNKIRTLILITSILNFISMKSFRPKCEQSIMTEDYDETLTEGDVGDYVNDLDLSVQQDYLIKLRTQREKIEQLSKLYESNTEKLQKALEENHKLEIQNSKLHDLPDYRLKYEEIKRQCDRVSQYSSRMQVELDSLRNQLQQAIHEKSQVILNMKNSIKVSKNKYVTEKQQLQQTLTDQQSLINELKSQHQDTVRQLNQEVKRLKNTIVQLKQQIENSNKQTNDQKISNSREIQQKNAELYELRHLINTIECESKRNKEELVNLQQIFESRQRQLRSQNEKIKYQLQQKNAQIKQKENMNRQNKSQILKMKSKLQQKDKQYEKIELQLRNAHQNYQTKLRMVNDNQLHEKAKYETALMEFRSSIDQLMDIKNHLISQNKKLTQRLRKKQQHDKIRKQLLKNQCKEIDKLQKIVDKIV